MCWKELIDMFIMIVNEWVGTDMFVNPTVHISRNFVDIADLYLQAPSNITDI